MKEKDKILAEIEAKLAEFDKAIDELNREARRENEKFTSGHRQTLEKVKANKERAETKLETLKAADKETWHRHHSELEGYLHDIDDDLRHALAYAM